jgi:hypothetical protein
MTTRVRARVVRRPSLPLTEQDDRDLLLIRESPTYKRALEKLSGEALGEARTSEAALLHAVFEAGVTAIRQTAEAEGYAMIAAEQATQEVERRAEARRRRPAWANEA